MISRPTIPALAALAAVLTTGLAIATVALAAFGGDAAFLERQRKAAPTRAGEIERLLLTTPSPFAPHRRDAMRARCTTRGSGELGNPWRCTVAYRSGPKARFRLTVRYDGSFKADHLDSSGAVVGCCVALTPAE